MKVSSPLRQDLSKDLRAIQNKENLPSQIPLQHGGNAIVRGYKKITSEPKLGFGFYFEDSFCFRHGRKKDDGDVQANEWAVNPKKS